MTQNNYDADIYELQERVAVLEERVNTFSNIFGEIAPLIDNLNIRLQALENKKIMLPPTKEEVHARMEIDGDGYQECEAAILRERYAGGPTERDGTTSDSETTFHVPV